MRFSLGCLSVVLIVSGSSQTLHADWPQTKHSSHIDYARNAAWPQPFRTADAISVMTPFEIMKNNGWRDNNTIGSTCFGANHELRSEGRVKVEWIVTQAPFSQRIVYVKSGRTREETNARIESVQMEVSQMIPTGDLPQILVTEHEPESSSGAYQTLVHRALTKTTPTPRLTKFSGINAPSQQAVAPTGK